MARPSRSRDRQHLAAHCRRQWPAAGDSRGPTGIAVVARSAPWPVHRSRRDLVESRSMVRMASRRVRPQRLTGPGQQLPAHAVELTDMPPPEAAQEGPARVDGALTTQPGTGPTVPPGERSAVGVGSMQSPPASAGWRPGVSILSPVFARPGAPPRSRSMVDDQFPQASGAGLGWPAGALAGIGHQADGRQRGCGYGRVCVLCGSNHIGCSLFPGWFLFQNHYPRFRAQHP